MWLRGAAIFFIEGRISWRVPWSQLRAARNGRAHRRALTDQEAKRLGGRRLRRQAHRYCGCFVFEATTSLSSLLVNSHCYYSGAIAFSSPFWQTKKLG